MLKNPIHCPGETHLEYSILHGSDGLVPQVGQGQNADCRSSEACCNTCLEVNGKSISDPSELAHAFNSFSLLLNQVAFVVASFVKFTTKID